MSADDGERQRGVHVSALTLFRVGIGPSSSHTVGPMRAAADFAGRLGPGVARVRVRLLGSLGATGAGHGTPDAVVAGLAGLDPSTCDPAEVRGRWARLDGSPAPVGGRLLPLEQGDVQAAPLTRLPRHPNAMVCTAWAADGAEVLQETYYSVGGGAIEREGAPAAAAEAPPLPHPYLSARELLLMAEAAGTDVAGVALANECALRPEAEVLAGLDGIHAAMVECVEAGLSASGELPGGLQVPRRAPAFAARLLADGAAARDGADWLDAVAMAVNEENAGGGRVVTAPTNGAAGILPAVLLHALALRLPEGPDEARTALARRFLLTATAIGSLYAGNASISGAECGCQGEVGSASSMAAGALCAVLGGTPAQVENAAEIAMEHNLGLTCDPVGGLVQIPCIERNAMGASKALVAARLALHGDGRHLVSLDAVIETMRQTGLDMRDEYKETAMGGLAVNVVEC
ncbi:L-serine ammonia-lyase [Amnibacterium endophyticum]|uniref:L-serine dehydratase n=1 Tax=Amnibacterium endophyticum TaxID=2109337 RepID=A0ABW4LJP6_9MICO